MGHMYATVGVGQGWGRGRVAHGWEKNGIMIFENNVMICSNTVEFHYVTLLSFCNVCHRRNSNFVTGGKKFRGPESLETFFLVRLLLYLFNTYQVN